jgi:N-acetylneuraminic acid mutarotase
VRSEVTVYEAVMGWVRSDVDQRRGAIGEVLGAVRLGLLPAAFLAETVATDPLIEPSFDAGRLLIKALSCHASGSIRDGADSGSLLRRRIRPADQGLMVIGGGSKACEVLASVECYDAQWRALPDMSSRRFGCAGACVDGLVYVVGGVRAGRRVASVECYDPSTGDWRAQPDMSVERSYCAAACVDGLLYVVGGLDENDAALASAECYDPSSGAWRALPDMSVVRFGCAAACIDGLLYVVGGQTGGNGRAVASAECYDPATKQWRGLPDMSVARADFVAVALP